MYVNQNEEIARLKSELSKLEQYGGINVPASAEIYYSPPNISVRGTVAFFLLLITLYLTYKYISEVDTWGTLYFFILTCLLALSLKDEIVKFFNKSVQIEMNRDYIIYKSERIDWGDIENDRIHYDTGAKTRQLLMLSFGVKGKNYNINITDPDISEFEFRYMYYTYKLRNLEKTDVQHS